MEPRRSKGRHDLFLNDVVVDGSGDVFVSDNRNGGIFAVDPQGRAWLWAAATTLGGPNRLLLDRGSLGWVTFFGPKSIAQPGPGRS
jgi:hypothetical protein